MEAKQVYKKFIYWIAPAQFDSFIKDVRCVGFEIYPVKKTSCETLKAKGKIIRFASPAIFSGLCKRQGSWYRESNKAGYYLVTSAERLSKKYDGCLDAVLKESNFLPESLPDKSEIKRLVESVEYQNQRPDDWEKKTLKEGLMVKILFSFIGVWKLKDTNKSQWSNHRANHANFLTHQHTIKLDGEEVPYSVTNNAGVCSSCVEFFNVIDQKSRKLVRACPGAVHFSNVELDKYYDIKPTYGKKLLH